MAAHSTCRLLVDPPESGAWNMAVDEALLTVAADHGIATLRFYQWSRPTLSLGYFQRYVDRQLHPPSSEVDVVRRLSGGGAILHDSEWTYSLMLPSNHALASDTQTLYRAFHKAIARWLNRTVATTEKQWHLQLHQPAPADHDTAQSFMCFARRSDGDVVLHRCDQPEASPNHKIVGSAQRRRRGAILQHGSLLVATSSKAPELTGFTEATSVELSQALFLQELTKELSEVLHLDLEPFGLTPELISSAHQLVDEKYATAAWTQRR